MRNIFSILVILISLPGFSAIRIFKGYIDKYPIHLVTSSYSDGDTRATYAYDKYNTPIVINGRQKNDSLILFEQDDYGDSVATFVFQDFRPEDKEIKGKWISQDKQKIYDVRLTKLQEFTIYDSTEFDELELMQPASTEDNYFNLLISKEEGEDAQVIGVRIYDKKTGKLIQELELECQFWWLNSISIGDYNFDGIDDFSVFEASYAGPNTSSIYILRDPNSEKYFISEISGTSLEFDSDAKLIYEHNQCCAGTRHMNATYKMVDNEMVLVEQSCIEYDEEKDDFVETDCD